MVDLYQLFFAVVGVGVLIIGGLFKKIDQEKVTNEKAQKITDAILEGAMTFLKEEYRIIALVIAVVAGVIAYYLGTTPAFIFALGSFLSMVTGFIGMRAATSANVRTTMAAKRSGEHAAFMVSFCANSRKAFSHFLFHFFADFISKATVRAGALRLRFLVSRLPACQCLPLRDDPPAFQYLDQYVQFS